MPLILTLILPLLRKELGKHKSDQPIASTLIRNRPLLNLTSVTQHFNSDGGPIRIRLSPLNETTEGFLSRGDKVARLFFLNRSSKDSLPMRPWTAGWFLSTYVVNHFEIWSAYYAYYYR